MGWSVGLSSAMRPVNHGVARAFAQVPGVGAHPGDGRRPLLLTGCLEVPAGAGAAMSPCLQGWHPHSRTATPRMEQQADLACKQRATETQNHGMQAFLCVMNSHGLCSDALCRSCSCRGAEDQRRLGEGAPWDGGLPAGRC